jgi:hypothetical protein
MQRLYNRAQLAELLSIAPATLRVRIAQGLYKPAALDGRGRELFQQEPAHCRSCGAEIVWLETTNKKETTNAKRSDQTQ